MRFSWLILYYNLLFAQFASTPKLRLVISPMTDILLLSTDFDGTLVDWIGPRVFPPALAEKLDELRVSGAMWAINTGRTLEMTLEGLRDAGFPDAPDFILSSEREIYRRNERGGWDDYNGWNTRCRSDLELLYKEAAEAFSEIERYILRHGGARLIYEGNRLAGLVAEDNLRMDAIALFLEEICARYTLFGFQRNSIYVRFCHAAYSKGATLTEVARGLGIPRSKIFAVGDHFNDIPMLDGAVAGMVACPSNAVAPVIGVVTKAGGYVSPRSCGEGVLDALEHFLAAARIEQV